jgi:phage tail tape-measure protein
MKSSESAEATRRRKKSGHRKPHPARSRRPTTRRTRQKVRRSATIAKAEKLCARLLDCAGQQAGRGNARLLAEILRFLRPSRPVIMLAGKNVLPIEN